MTTPDLGVGSHVPILAAAIARTTGPILECGAGAWSTPLIHAIANGRAVMSLETDQEWMNKMAFSYKAGWHQFGMVRADGHHQLIAEWVKLGLGLAAFVDGVCFLDQSPGEARVPMAKVIKGKFKYIVAHDTDADIPPGGGNYGWAQLDGYFKYQFTFKDVRPWTTVYSDEEPFGFIA